MQRLTHLYIINVSEFKVYFEMKSIDRIIDRNIFDRNVNLPCYLTWKKLNELERER